MARATISEIGTSERDKRIVWMIELMKEHILDELEIDGIKIKKALHPQKFETSQEEPRLNLSPEEEMDMELFGSTVKKVTRG